MAQNYITIQDALFGAGVNIFSIIYQFLPNLLAAILVFLIGIILGNWVKSLTYHVLESIDLTKLTRKTSLDGFLQKAEIKTKAEEVISLLLKWLVILIFSVAAINLLGLETLSMILNSLLAYIPKVFAAMIILALGVLLAGVVESLVKGAVAQFDVRIGRLLGRIASYILVVFASMAALNELGIAKDLINVLFIGFVAMLSLGFGLAIGLGAKDVVSEVLKQWYKKIKDM